MPHYNKCIIAKVCDHNIVPRVTILYPVPDVDDDRAELIYSESTRPESIRYFEYFDTEKLIEVLSRPVISLTGAG